jgi:hypothetical protein
MTIHVRPGDLIGYNLSPGEYYWLVFGSETDPWVLRMDWNAYKGKFQVIEPYTTSGQFDNHHLVHRSRP